MPSRGRRRSRALTVFAGLILLGLAGTAVVIGLIGIDRRRPTTLPAPTGPFAVGRTTATWTDETPEPLAPAGATRALMAWIWYPADVDEAAPSADYVPSSWRTAMDDGGSALMRFLTRDLAGVHDNSLRDANVAARQPAYPVVILRAGASAQVSSYATLAEDLASHGYVVVGLDAPYRTGLVVFSDGRVATRAPENNPELFTGEALTRMAEKLMTAWTGDIAFALDRLAALNASDPDGRFAGRLDLARVGVFGHSFGGAQALQFCHEDARCRAAIDIDGAPVGSVVQAGLEQPVLFIESEHGDPSDPGNMEVEANIRSIYNRLPASARRMVKIRGANHFMFSDDGALLKSHVLIGLLRAVRVVGIDGARQLAATAYCVRTFFDAYLNGAATAVPELSSPQYPEVQILR
jgi:dienelactone hydrolase